jgi:N-acetylmuramoyl-L-alanine amidase
MARIAYNGSGFLTFYQQLATNNPCYQQNNNRLKTTHLILHSTAADNPNLKRYVTPDDGMLGENKYNNGWNNPKSSTLVHGVIGKNKNGFVEAYQIAPWGKLVWGCGSGLNGSGNSFAIQVEMCEDDTLGANYAKETYNVAVKLFAHLCKSYDIPVENIWSHNEANAKGYASGHVDPEHWWKKVKSGLTMDGFRKDVAALLGGEKTKEQLPAEASASRYVAQVGAFTLKKNSTYKLNALKSAGYNNAFVELENGWWKVRLGPYTKKNAEKQVAKLEKDGFSAIIVKVK